MKKFISGLFAWAGVSTAVAQAAGVELYRFQNEDGVVVLAQAIPPELVYKGYTVVGEDGTVIRIIPRALTPEELAQRDRDRAAGKEVEAGHEVQIKKDEALLRQYASIAEVMETRDRKVQAFDVVVASTKANVTRLKLQKQRLEEQAAERERAGQLASPEILENLAILTTQIGDKEREVVARQREQEQVREQFQRDIERFEEIIGSRPVGAAATQSLD